jgi:hypothetical protein
MSEGSRNSMIRIPTNQRAILATFALVAAMVGFAAAPAAAALIAEESFDYTANDLAGNGSASDPGWAGGWTGDGSVTSPGFDYIDSNSDSLVVAGNKANFAGGSNDSASAFRELSSPQSPTTSDPVWISVIMKRNASDDNRRAFLLSFSQDEGQPEFNIGQATGGGSESDPQPWFANITNRTGGSARGTASRTNTLNKAFLVAKLTTDGTNATLDVFVNPDLDSAPATAAISVTGDVAAFDTVRLFAGNNTGGVSLPAQADFDEIRIGTTFRSVAPIPEPATVGLIALGGMMLLGRRGRGNRDVGLHA